MVRGVRCATTILMEKKMADNNIVRGSMYLVPVKPGLATKSEIPELRKLYPIMEPGGILVRVCAHGGGSENWAHNGHPELDHKFPLLLPAILLAEKREGDTIIVMVGDRKCELTLAQGTSPYATPVIKSFQHQLDLLCEQC